MNTMVRGLLTWLLAASAWAATGAGPIPLFEATALTGEKVSSRQLIGQPTILIVTPSKGAAADTREWAKALRQHVAHEAVRVRDVLCIDLPFFMSEQDALSRAKEKIPARYHDQTWLFAKDSLETALNIPTDSNKAYVLVLDAQGRVATRVEGAPTDASVSQVDQAVQRLR